MSIKTKKYSLNKVFSKLITVSIVIVLSFDNAGYCLRVPMETGYARMHAADNRISDDQWALIEDFNKSILLNKKTGRIKLAETQPAVNIDFDLWIVRHGETEGNLIKGLFQGAVDEDINQLNGKGRRQANDAAKALFKKLDHKIRTEDVVVVSSKFRRAKDTAKSFVKLVNRVRKSNITISEEELASEMSFGLIDNKTPDQLSDKQQIFVARYRQGLDATVIPEGGENFINVLSRSKDLLMKLNKLYKGKTVLLYGHGTQTSAIRALLGDRTLLDTSGQIDWREKMVPTASPVLFASHNSNYITEVIKYDINISNKELFEGKEENSLLNMAKQLEVFIEYKTDPVRFARACMMLADLYGKYLPDKSINKEKSAMYEKLASESINKTMPLNSRIRKNVKMPKAESISDFDIKSPRSCL